MWLRSKLILHSMHFLSDASHAINSFKTSKKWVKHLYGNIELRIPETVL